MAANDYYNSHPQSQAPYYQNNGFTSQTPVTPYEGHSHPLGSMNSYGTDSQGPDARYYGQAGSQSSFRDDIPLRDHPAAPAKDDEATDHVYDAPANTVQGGRPNRNSGNGNGFFKKPLKKIPWVVYTLTLIQIAVFIAEIAKNGMCCWNH